MRRAGERRFARGHFRPVFVFEELAQVVGVQPSASLAGSIASSAGVESALFGSGSCSKIPSTLLSAFNFFINATSSAIEVEAGSG